ncbi:MAG: rhodanese-related sulfurtransferase [Pseudomonadales bacterium]|nr:rhodanese-related sulfurtransferase [Pseudomonadales bacterium]
MRRVLAFYQFLALEDPQGECDRLQTLGDELALRGTILVAAEGVNGTVVGDVQALHQLSSHLTERYGVKSQKWSDLASGNSGFHRFKVRVKPEIVSFGVENLDMQQTGEHVDAETWNALIDDPEVIVIDTRNDYEIDIGTFEGAVSPNTENFRQFPSWVADNLDAQKHTKVAMFCTGGIRCEKASSYLFNRGFESVYQLDGGILQYLQDTQAEDSRWNGECFVFDQRVSVNAQLQQGQYQQCYACRHPLSATELASTDFEHGVSCPHCIERTSAERRQQFRERQHQVRLAQERGEQHIGLRQKKQEGNG